VGRAGAPSDDKGDGDAGNRAGYRDDGSRSWRRAPHRRNRLYRTGPPRPDWPQISPLRQPERDIPEDALAVHGITAEFLASQPPFAAIVDELLAFIGPDRLVIHNAEFDIAFLDAELARLQREPLGCPFVDTLGLARVRFPGVPASLDALCRRFDIDLSMRVEHGAQIDCGLLAAVYLELLGGRQPGLDFALPADTAISVERISRPARPHAPSPEELIAHQAMLRIITDPIWLMEA
jgi:DNA polymerase-3 subunit epsilon